MIINFKGEKIKIKAKETNILTRFSGLMFKSLKTQNLLFQNARAIHSFFVLFPFLAIWLDEKNKVTDYRIVKPFTFHVSPKLPSSKLLELPLNEQNRKTTRFFVD